jgi:hypothetical protein
VGRTRIHESYHDVYCTSKATHRGPLTAPALRPTYSGLVWDGLDRIRSNLSYRYNQQLFDEQEQEQMSFMMMIPMF